MKNRRGITKQRRYMWETWMEGVRVRRRHGERRRKGRRKEGRQEGRKD